MSDISGIIGSIRTIMWQDTGLNGDAQRIEQLGWMLFLKIFSDKDLEMELMDSKYKFRIRRISMFIEIMKNINKTLKGSHVYSQILIPVNTTPKGSHHWLQIVSINMKSLGD